MNNQLIVTIWQQRSPDRRDSRKRAAHAAV